MSSFPCVGLKISRVPQAANMRSLGDADERHYLSALRKKPGGQPGLLVECRSFERVSLGGLAECLGDARLERLHGRERDLLCQRCKFLGLLGQCLQPVSYTHLTLPTNREV